MDQVSLPFWTTSTAAPAAFEDARRFVGVGVRALLCYVIRGHAFVQNLRRGHYELGVEVAPVFRLATAFDELQRAI